jgi:hypothetical protein
MIMGVQPAKGAHPSPERGGGTMPPGPAEGRPEDRLRMVGGVAA